MKALLGRKLGMTQIFDESGNVVPVTIIEAGPCVVTQVKTTENDGYSAVQFGFEEFKKLSKPEQGHQKKTKTSLRHLTEIRTDNLNPGETGDNNEAESAAGLEELKVGDKFDVTLFAAGDAVKVTGLSKGKGFAGTIKRHNFSRGPKSHGSHNYRAPGSIGAGYPEHVFRGQKMAGQMGAIRTTIMNLNVIQIDQPNNLILVKGAVPGARRNLVLVRGLS